MQKPAPLQSQRALAAYSQNLSGIGTVLDHPWTNTPIDQPTFPIEMGLWDQIYYQWLQNQGKAVDLNYSLVQCTGCPSVAPRPHLMPNDITTEPSFGY